jgi:uncharacterized protein
MHIMNRKFLEPSDYPALKSSFERQSFNLSIYSLSSLIAWNDGPVKTYYAFDRDILLISSVSTLQPKDRYLIIPLSGRGMLTPEELHDLAIDHGYREYRFVPGDYLDAMGRKKTDIWFNITEQPEFEDYIYRTEDLAQLKGRHYVRKRNLIHQFMREYHQNGRVTVENLTAVNTGACMAFIEQWCQQRECDQNESLTCEKNALVKTLLNIELIESKGIIIKIDGTVCALAIMSHLNERMGVLNFEKAFSTIRGLYQFLDNECAKRLFAGYEFINKECDMNIAELAQSKKSYYPLQRIKSYRLIVR